MSGAQDVHHRREDCRVCGGRKLTKFLSLGEQPLANAFLRPGSPEIAAEERYPLDVYVCSTCWHAQLLDVVSKETLFEHYLYFSTTTRTTPAHFAQYAREAAAHHSVFGDLIVEIGSNDGVLLSAFDPRERRILGVEPAKNIAEFARRQRSIPTMNRYWSAETATMIARDLGDAKVIISNNVIGHIDDLAGTSAAVKTLLVPDGVWMWEVPYLVDLIEKDAFDTVYHEHLSYFALHPAKLMLERAGLKLVDVKRFPIHGGTIRIYAKHREAPGEPSAEVARLLTLEKDMRLDTIEPFVALASRVEGVRVELNSMLAGLKQQAKRIVGYGAPAKGNTLLNYCGIGPETLDYCLDTTPVKQGLVTPGTHVPIVHPDEFGNSPPDVALMLAWNYEREILAKEDAFRKRGGKFVIPIPTPRLV